MALIDQIIGVESGGNPNARNPNSSAMGAGQGSSLYVREKLGADLLICKLLFARGPAAVLGRVVPVVVNAIKRVFLAWPWPHIGKEVLKAIPALANFDASRPVVFVGGMFGEGASATHAIPYLVFGGGPPASIYRYGHAVGCGRPTTGFLSGATAANRISRPQVGHRYDLFNSAIAHAMHSADSGVTVLANFGRGFRNGSQSSEFLADAVYGGGH